MGIERISENVYSIGVINPSLRVFDIVMQAKYGTSYNAYLITGKSNILIETVHSDYFDEYLNNLRTLVDVEDIDYIVMNHTELDHSGSLKKLLEINPKITVVCTTAASKYLKNILNSDFNCKIVKDNDVLSFGDKSVEFKVAPLLHWPDSMMTWFEEDKVLFSCDFLGCHFCEPTMLYENIKYKKEYLGEFRYYYDGIFSPFKPYVLKGIEKIKDLDIEYVCPSHGPVLTKDIKDRINDYKVWSTPQDKSEKNIVIIYASAYKCTKLMAEAAAQEIRDKSSVNVKLYDMVVSPVDVIAKEIAECDAIMVGSCTINRDAPKVVWDVLSSIDAINTKMKPAGAFGSFGWSGEAVDMIKSRLTQLKFNFIGEGVKANFMPNENDIEKIKKYSIEIINKIK